MSEEAPNLSMRAFDDVPAKYRPMQLRAALGKSRKAAIRLFCVACVGYSEAEVRCCTATDCPLYPYRGG